MMLHFVLVPTEHNDIVWNIKACSENLAKALPENV